MSSDPVLSANPEPGFPVFLRLKGRRVVVAGTGMPVLVRAQLLAESGADVHLFCTDAVSTLPAAITLHARAVRSEDFSGAALCYVVFPDRKQASEVVALARQAGVLVGAVDQPELSDFITPAVVRRGPVRVAISTSGAAPALARALRGRIERALPEVLGPLTSLCGAWRTQIKARYAHFADRRRFWDALIAGPVAAALRHGEISAVEDWIKNTLAAGHLPPHRGRAFLVGAGPGDPGLMTQSALQALHEADIILHDALVGPEILEMARREAQLINVGKRCGRHSMKQAEITARLIAEVRSGKTVVRLKGGDPLIFGRGGEEVAALRAAGLQVEVIPGVTAALGVAARLGIPLTERGLSRTLHLITAHKQAGALPDYDWDAMVRLGGTLAIYMGVRTLPALAERLMAAGMRPDMPAIAIENATLPNERPITAPLSKIGAKLAAAALTGPTLVLIGEVVAQVKPETKHTDQTQAAFSEA